MHRAKGDRWVCASMLPVRDNVTVSDKGDQNSVSLSVHTSTIYIKVFLAAVIAMGVKFYIANDVLCTLFCAYMSLLTLLCMHLTWWPWPTFHAQVTEINLGGIVHSCRNETYERLTFHRNCPQRTLRAYTLTPWSGVMHFFAAMIAVSVKPCLEIVLGILFEH